MSNRNAAAVLEVDGLVLEKENRELASKQVRQINDALLKVRRISRESKQAFKSVAVAEDTSTDTEADHNERDDSTDRLLIPEPTLDSPVRDVFKKALDMFEKECTQFRLVRDKNSPVIRTWKLT